MAPVEHCAECIRLRAELDAVLELLGEERKLREALQQNYDHLGDIVLELRHGRPTSDRLELSAEPIACELGRDVSDGSQQSG